MALLRTSDGAAFAQDRSPALVGTHDSTLVMRASLAVSLWQRTTKWCLRMRQPLFVGVGDRG